MNSLDQSNQVEANAIPPRVYWFRNVPSKPTYANVESVDDGLKLLNALAEMDLQDKSVISNVGGLQYFNPEDNSELEDDGW